jgi:oligopeptide/dipeptide ABC transporter ATP-binding protein
MIFQDPMSALNPVFTVRTHLVDVLRRRYPELGRKECNRRAAEMMTRVGIPDAERRMGEYPHQFSGGMRQRVIIAMALLSTPDLVIADEPTTALDATTEAQIVRLFSALRAEYSGSILFISHSLGLVAELCDEVVVFYAGTLVEAGPAAEIFANPSHPYTRALLACEIVDDGEGGPLPSIPGEVPDLVSIPAGCIFAPRCERVAPECLRAIPRLREVRPGQRVACWRA